MLVDYEWKAGKLVISYIAEDGNIKMKNYNWRNPKKYVVTDNFDRDASKKYKTWNNRKVKLVGTNQPNRYSVYEFLDRLPVAEQEEIYKFNQPNFFYMDIETEIIDTGFVEPKDATTKVQTLSYPVKGISLHQKLSSFSW